MEKYFLRFGNNMSRIAKKPILIPAGVTINVDGGVLSVKGSLGVLSKNIPPSIKFDLESNQITLSLLDNSIESRALWGTFASHIKNMISGVQKIFEKRVIIEGIGYKVDVKGLDMVFSLGFSHTIHVTIPNGLKVATEKGGLVIISGIDLESVTAFASKIRSLKKPEPYKGKGVRYADEVIRRKQGKKAA